MAGAAALLAAVLGISFGLNVNEDVCYDEIVQASREGVGVSSGGVWIYETCTTHFPSGRVIEASYFHWWSVAFAVPMAVGTWFTFAGALRLVRTRLAVAALGASVVAFLLVCAVLFI